MGCDSQYCGWAKARNFCCVADSWKKVTVKRENRTKVVRGKSHSVEEGLTNSFE
jgi:hypothetical protein